MKSEVLYNKNGHKWVVMGRDPDKQETVIDTNQYIVQKNDQTVLLDPGGIEIFPQVLAELTRHADTENIKTIVASHQDPDIASSLAMWVDLIKELDVYCSWIWSGFIAHFGMGTKLDLQDIPDEGMALQIGNTGAMIYLVPAHYCHSSGNFSVYDPEAEILMSGDIGAALLPEENMSLFCEDFDQHIRYMDAFHKRWMPSSIHLKKWVQRVRTLKPKMICPQHGSIFRGEDVDRFLNWLEGLEVGQYNAGMESEDMNKAVWMAWNR